MIMLVLFIALFTASPLFAAEYWVSTTGSNSNSCSAAQSSATPKLTISAGIGCMVGGDTLIIKAGTYTNQEITNPPAGTASAYTVIKGDPNGARPVINPDRAAIQRGFYCSRGETCKYIEINYLEITNGYNGYKLDGTDTIGYSHHMRIINNVFHDQGSTDILISTSVSGGLGGDHFIQGNEFYRTGIHNPGYGPGHNTIYNPGNRSIVEHNTFHNLQHGVAIWVSNKTIVDVIVRYNLFYEIGRENTDTWEQGSNGSSAIRVSTGGGGHQIYGNVVYNSGDKSTFSGILIHPYGATDVWAPVSIYNNTIYDNKNASSEGIRVGSVVPGTDTVMVYNNIVLNAGLGIRDISSASAGDLRNNLTAGTASTIFTNSATYDLTLKSGSAAINAGTASTGLSFCGTSPDQGAFETLAVTAASIAGNTLDVTVCSAVPPVQPLGTWTPACTGAGCGTPVSGSASIVGGGLVRIPVSGITGGNCAAGQTWTISASGANTDSALIGNSQNQTLHTVTSFAVDSSACNGSGSSTLPGGALAIYELDGNTNDSSGNANHAIGSANISYETGKYSQGAQTTAALNSYVDTGLLNGTNPSSTHVVIAAGVYIAPGQLSDTADLFGTDIGTNQKLIVYRSNTNIWKMIIQGTTGADTEFPVVSGWTHVCLKMNATTDVATLYINGMAGALSNASTIAYTSYTLPSTLRFGLPVGFSLSLAGTQIFDRAVVYTTDVSCSDIYNNWEPTVSAPSVAQVAHQWQGVYTISGVAENRGSPDAQRTVNKGGYAALMAQINCTGGDCGALQPRFRYNINGAAFTNVIPDTPTADGISMWGAGTSVLLNSGIADGPISGSLSHTDGITLTTSAAIPTLSMGNNTSYTLRGIFRIDAAVGDTVCFEIYDQGGSALASYNPPEGACLTVISPQASGAF